MQLEGKKKHELCNVWDLSLEFFYIYNRLFLIEFKFVINLLLNHATWVKQKQKRGLCGISV